MPPVHRWQSVGCAGGVGTDMGPGGHDMTGQATFAALHAGPGPFLLPNAWDVASGVLLAEAGFAAIGTTSLGGDGSRRAARRRRRRP